MISSLLKTIFGSRNERLLKKYRKSVHVINALETRYQSLSDEALREQTQHFRERLQASTPPTLYDLLPEAFAVCREAARRVLGMRHFDVQLIGGMALHEGRIAEMRTGEGKTLVATLPVYLNALTGQGVHVITVNDYLAERDANWMGRLFRFLGLSVGVNLANMRPADKKAAYACDITYGTNNEFGFDYLRDNMVYAQEEKVQRPLFFAVVDEVDSILIDEARTPLIISGQSEDEVGLYQQMQQLVVPLSRQEGDGDDVITPGDFVVDEKNQQILLTEEGHENAEQLLIAAGLLAPDASLYDAENISLLHHVYAALRAQHLFFKDQHYVVRHQEVVIVDEFTGRLMPGRRWSEGLHQAVEAKEHVPIQKENKTLASITFQNYFRLYQKLSGMTGTADTEAAEFYEIYGLETVVMPTHLPVRRQDFMDQVYIDTQQKYAAIVQDIQRCHEAGQPVLVGTTSIENSEMLSQHLNQMGLPHQVLNAKQHAKEAEIIAQAGYPGVITIATNMAGRGTDIVLGGNIDKERQEWAEREEITEEERAAGLAVLEAAWHERHEQVLAAGGLHVIGTERHESRRIDNQLRGRSGRQGDPGSSRFYLSLEDSLMRIFAGDRVKAIMSRLRLPENEPIEHPLVTRSLETAQRKVESRHFDVRKQLLQYDDVANEQRKIIYQQRDVFLAETEPTQVIETTMMTVLSDVFYHFVPRESVEQQWDVARLMQCYEEEYVLSLPVDQWLRDQSLDVDQLLLRIQEAAKMQWDRQIAEVRLLPEADHMLVVLFRGVLLQALDTEWRDHLSHLDYLRQGIHLRGYAAKNPQQEYKREAFLLFQRMLERMKSRIVSSAMRLQQDLSKPPVALESPSVPPLGAIGENLVVGRNEPCPCGSGKKYKHCHGRIH